MLSFLFSVLADLVSTMKNKISTFLTGLPDSIVGKHKNKKKRKEISSDSNEGNDLGIVKQIS